MQITAVKELNDGDRIIARKYDYTVVDEDGKVKYNCFYKNLSRKVLMKAIDIRREREKKDDYQIH